LCLLVLYVLIIWLLHQWMVYSCHSRDGNASSADPAAAGPMITIYEVNTFLTSLLMLHPTESLCLAHQFLTIREIDDRKRKRLYKMCIQLYFGPYLTNTIITSPALHNSRFGTVICYAAGCMNPNPPKRGVIEGFDSAEENATLTYRCSPDLVPRVQMSSVCTNMSWSPDPSTLECREPLPGRLGIDINKLLLKVIALSLPLSHTHTPLFYPSLSSHSPLLERWLAQPPTLSSQVEPCASLADHSATWRAGEREGWEWVCVCACACVQYVVYFILSSHTASIYYMPSSLYTLPRTSTMHNWVFCFPPLLSSLPSWESAVPPPWQTTPCLPSSALHCSRSGAHRTHTTSSFLSIRLQPQVMALLHCLLIVPT